MAMDSSVGSSAGLLLLFESSSPHLFCQQCAYLFFRLALSPQTLVAISFKLSAIRGLKVRRHRSPCITSHQTDLHYYSSEIES